MNVFWMILLLAGTVPAETVNGPAGERIDRFMRIAESLGFSGVVAISVQGETVLDKGYGLANRKAGVPNTAATAFDIGSITKQFTAAAIMKLVDQGKLEPGQTIATWFPVGEDKQAITVHHLLTHTAGLINFTGGDYQRTPRDKAVGKALSAELLFPPGSDWAYSNAGYSVAAAIVEKVSGRTYEDFVQAELFAPAGIRWIGYRGPDWSRVVVSRQYTNARDNGTPLEKAYPYWNLLGNGGMLAISGDMLRWHRALVDETVLSETAKRQMYTPDQNNYAYGWDVRQSKYGTLIEHNGGNDLGARAQFSRYVDRDTVIYFASNRASDELPLYHVVARCLTMLVFGTDLPEQAAIAAARSWAGEHRVGDSILEARFASDQLVLLPSGQSLLDRGRSGTEAAARSAQTVRIVNALVEGDKGPFLDALADQESRARRAAYLDDRLGEIGGLVSFRVLGTVDAWWSTRVEPVTFIQAVGREQPLLFRLHWQDDRIRGIGGQAIPFPDLWMWFPQTETEGVAWSPITGRAHRLVFTETDGSVTVSLPGQ